MVWAGRVPVALAGTSGLPSWLDAWRTRKARALAFRQIPAGGVGAALCCGAAGVAADALAEGGAVARCAAGLRACKCQVHRTGRRGCERYRAPAVMRPARAPPCGGYLLSRVGQLSLEGSRRPCGCCVHDAPAAFGSLPAGVRLGVVHGTSRTEEHPCLGGQKVPTWRTLALAAWGRADRVLHPLRATLALRGVTARGAADACLRYPVAGLVACKGRSQKRGNEGPGDEGWGSARRTHARQACGGQAVTLPGTCRQARAASPAADVANSGRAPAAQLHRPPGVGHRAPARGQSAATQHVP